MDLTAQASSKRRSAAGDMLAGRLFNLAFSVALVISAVVTFFTIRSLAPDRAAASGPLIGLLVVNTILITVTAALVWVRYRQVRSLSPGNGALARRLLITVASAAAVPTIAAAILLGVALSQGINSWFGSRVSTAMESVAEYARTSLEDYSQDLEQSSLALAAAYLEAPASVSDEEVLRQAVPLFGFRNGYIVDASGRVVARAEYDPQLAFMPPDASAMLEASLGRVAQTLFEDAGLATALLSLDDGGARYLLLVRPFSPELSRQLRGAEEALLAYREAAGRSGTFQLIFGIGYVQLSLLMVLLAAFLGLNAAAGITEAVQRLARGARRVREGALDTTLPLSGSGDELDSLTRDFNTMTDRLARQRTALLTEQQASEERRALLETLMDTVSVGIVRADASGRVTLANPAALKMLGADPAEVLQLGDLAPEAAAAAAEVLESGAALDRSLVLNEPGGAARNIRLRVRRESIGSLLLTFDDTTRLTQVQRQLAWRDVARRIAHEIRNPLTPIQLSAERLQKRFGDLAASAGERDKAVFDRSIDIVLRQVGTIREMVEEFSSFARMPAPSMDEADLSAVISRVVFELDTAAPDVVVSAALPAKPIRLRGDERLLGQAISNIVLNAVQACAEQPSGSGGHHVSVTAAERRGDVIVTVEDDGPGIPANLRSTAFEPYVTTRESGTGLGLAIVQRIVLDHGGRLALAEREGGRPGTVVQITLPLEGPGATSPGEQSGPAKDHEEEDPE